MTCENYTNFSFTVHKQNFTGAQPCTFVSILAVAIFTLQVEQLFMAAKPKIYTIWSRAENVHLYLSKASEKGWVSEKSIVFWSHLWVLFCI